MSRRAEGCLVSAGRAARTGKPMRVGWTTFPASTARAVITLANQLPGRYREWFEKQPLMRVCFMAEADMQDLAVPVAKA